MTDQEKRLVGRRGFLGLLAKGGAGAAVGVGASVGIGEVAQAEMTRETRSDKRKARYRVTPDVEAYYRVNRYPPAKE